MELFVRCIVTYCGEFAGSRWRFGMMCCCGVQGCSAAAFCVVSCKRTLNIDVVRFESQFHRRSRLTLCVVGYVLCHLWCVVKFVRY